MKTYNGAPGADGNNVVMVTGPGGVAMLPGGPFGWGKDLRRAALAKALLLDHFDGDEGRASRLYGRFMWRVLAGLPDERAWSISGREVEAIIKSIEEGDADTARIRSSVATVRAPVENEGGRSVVDGQPLPPIEVKG